MDSDTVEIDEDSVNDYFRNESDMILEGEEEYDVLNDETFGGSVIDFAKKDEVDVPLPHWEDYDQHNDKTFGEEINFDWETDPEKIVGVFEYKVEGAVSKSGLTKTTSVHDYDNITQPDNVNINDCHKADRQLQIGNSYEAKLIKLPWNTSSPADNIINAVSGNALDDFGHAETLTNNKCSRFLKQDKWCNKYGNCSLYGSNSDQNVPFSHGYSLFPSSTNLLQSADINIPSVSCASLGINTVDNIEKRLGDMKLKPNSSSPIQNVDDSEKQLITPDCFGAYNGAFLVNSNSTSNNTCLSNALSLQSKPSIGSSMDPFSSQDAFRNESSGAVGGPLQNMFSIASNTNKRFPFNGDFNSRSFSEIINPTTSRLPSYLEPKAFPVPVMTESGILMCDNTVFKNVSNLAEVNTAVSPFVNNMMTRTKALPTLDQSVIIISDTSSGIIDGSLLLENSITNSNVARMNMNVFPTLPVLTLDPKLCFIQNTPAALESRHQMTSSLSLQPLQVLNCFNPSEQQQKIAKLQKQYTLSNTDEYAGLMTEREKYWLAGVQLLQINAMDPYKDDYYFINYQARHKGSRNKTQNNINSNNNKWKTEHVKDYCPLQFENSLGKVQIGSVVTPRKVFDIDVFDGSPKHNGKLNDSFHDDPIANTSNRKRKAIMLHIENMYGKIMALESLHLNSTKNKIDPALIKSEFEDIVSGLKKEILGLKDDFKIIMSIKKGKRLVLRFLSYCENPDDVWYQIFEILDRVMQGDQDHCILLSYLPYFRAWLVTADLTIMNRIAEYFKKNITFFLKDKFSVSVIANMIEYAEETYLYSNAECQNKWMEFILMLSESVSKSVNIQKPVILVKPQVLCNHLLKCKNLENGYISDLLKIFSNNARK